MMTCTGYESGFQYPPDNGSSRAISALFAVFIMMLNVAKTEGKNASETVDYSEQESSDLMFKMTLTLSITIPCALVVGVAWCYCMSCMCGIRDAQGSKTKGQLHLPHSDYDNHGYDPESSPESSAPGSPMDSPVLGDHLPVCNYSGSPPLDLSRPSSPGGSSIGSQQPSTSSALGT